MSTINTTPAAVPAMEPAAIINTAAAILAKYASISAIKAAAPALRAKYGPDNWKKILQAAKDARRDAIQDYTDKARAAVTYSAVLDAVYNSVIAKDASYKALAKIAGAKYGNGAAAGLVRDYYTAVDAAGAPLRLVRYIDDAAGLVYSVYELAELGRDDAARVLDIALRNMGKTAKDAARKGKDAKGARAEFGNVREPGKIAAVYCPGGADGLTLIRADKPASAAAADALTIKPKDAAALVGKACPAGLGLWSDVVSAARAAEKAAGAAALARERAAIAADAAAAGMGTAPKGRK